MWAITGYAPRRYRGRAAQFWARDEHGKSLNDLSKRWQVIIDDLGVYSTPGTHFSAITTHVEALAEQLRAWLNAGEDVRASQSTTDNG